MKVKSHFHNVGQLIATIKAATVKNKSKQAQFLLLLVTHFSLLLRGGEAG